MLGDTAIAVHPDDPRYTHLKGKFAVVPIVNRKVPIIFDAYVEMEFGTGALKVTPAHDPNDYELGKKHDLEVIDILNDNATISEAGLFYVGEGRFKARKLILNDLTAADSIVKIEDLTHNVGRSERTNSIVEPKLSLQWYVDMKSLAEPALAAVENDEIKFQLVIQNIGFRKEDQKINIESLDGKLLFKLKRSSSVKVTEED